MTGYRIVFDRDEMVLRWKESDCKPRFLVLVCVAVYLFIFGVSF